MKGELYDIADYESGELSGLPHVFALGNVLTGQGNIRDSRFSARDVSQKLASEYLGIGDDIQVDKILADSRNTNWSDIETKLSKFPASQ